MLSTQSNFNQLISNPLNTNTFPNNLSTLQTSPLNLTAQPLQGASQTTHTFTVTNINDSGAGSLRQAILNANADSLTNPNVADVINFNLGTGAHTITLTSTNLDITAKNLTINGTGPNNLTISGGGKLRDFKIEAGANVTISKLTIANGLSDPNGGIYNGGGGIRNDGTLTLNNSVLSNNTATRLDVSNGGAIFNNGTLIANGDTFTDNKALVNRGGAIFNAGSATITNSSFANNTAITGGGAIVSLSNLTITNSTFTNNSVISDGVGGAVAGIENAKVTITGSTFTGNSALNGSGGALYNSGTLKVTTSSFNNNRASLGAAIYEYDNPHGVTATALGLAFSGNVSTASNGTPGNNNDTFGTFVATVDTLADTNDANFTAGHLSLRNAINGAINGETIDFSLIWQVA
jgi:predicted outer membrane repeat protein